MKKEKTQDRTSVMDFYYRSIMYSETDIKCHDIKQSVIITRKIIDIPT